MKNLIRTVFIFLLLFSALNAKMFQTVDINKGTFIQKGDSKFYCKNCGMNLPKFYKTNHVHKNKQYCSLHCLVASTDHKLPSDAKVVDTQSLKFNDAKKAYYVVGSTKRGTMSVNSKYAFLNKEDAENFSKKYGGDIVGFEKAYAIAREDFSKDMSMIKTKKEKKVYKTGQMLQKKCDKVDLSLFSNIAQLKAQLKSSCKLKKDKQLQAVAIYLWDTQKMVKKLLIQQL